VLDGALFDRVARGARRRRRRAGTAVVSAVAAVMLVSPLAIHALSTHGSKVAAGNAANRAATERDVAARLAAIPLPPGSRRLPRPPAEGSVIDDQWLDSPGPYHVSREEWYRYPGALSDVMRFLGDATVVGQPPSGPSTMPPTGFDITWHWPDLRPQTVARAALVTTLSVDGTVLIRVAAEAEWLPARPPDITIGPEVRSITIQSAAPGWAFGPITVTDPARVAAVVDLVNGLGMAVPDFEPSVCMLDGNPPILVDFKDASGRVVDELETACGDQIQITAEADDMTVPLIGPADGRSLQDAIASLLGPDWPGHH